MSTKFSLLTIVIAIIALPLMLAGGISAQTIDEQSETIQNNRQELQQDIEENREQRQEAREESVEQRCSIATTRIDNITARYDDNRLRYVERYDRLTERLENLVSYLNENQPEVDTSTLEAQIAEMRGQSSLFSAEIDAAISELEQSKQFACGESEGAYRNELQEARAELLDAREKAVEINNYFLNTIIPELENIRNSVQS